MNPGIFIFRFSFCVSTCLSNNISLIPLLISTELVSPMLLYVRTVQLKQSSGLSKYINVLQRNFYAPEQKLP